MIKLKTKITAALLAATALFSAVSAATFDVALRGETAAAYISVKYNGSDADVNISDSIRAYTKNDTLNTYYAPGSSTGEKYWEVIDTSTKVTISGSEYTLAEAAERAGAAAYGNFTNFSAYYKCFVNVLTGYYSAILDVKLGEYNVSTKTHYIASYGDGVKKAYELKKEELAEEFQDKLKELMKADGYDSAQDSDTYISSKMEDKTVAEAMKKVFDDFYEENRNFFKNSDEYISGIQEYYNGISTENYKDEWKTELSTAFYTAISDITSADSDSAKEAAVKAGKISLAKIKAKYNITIEFNESKEAYSAKASSFESKLNEYIGNIESADDLDEIDTIEKGATAWNTDAVAFYKSIALKKAGVTEKYQTYTDRSEYSEIASLLNAKRDYFLEQMDDVVYEDDSSTAALNDKETEAIDVAKYFAALFDDKNTAIDEIGDIKNNQVDSNAHLTSDSLKSKIKTTLQGYIDNIEDIFDKNESSFSLSDIQSAQSSIKSKKEEADDYYDNQVRLISDKETYLEKLEALYAEKKKTYHDADELENYYEEADSAINGETDIADNIKLAYEKFEYKVKAYETYAEYSSKATISVSGVEDIKASYETEYKSALSKIDAVTYATDNVEEVYENYVSALNACSDSFRQEYKTEIQKKYESINQSFFKGSKFESFVNAECGKLDEENTPDEIYETYKSLVEREESLEELIAAYNEYYSGDTQLTKIGFLSAEKTEIEKEMQAKLSEIIELDGEAFTAECASCKNAAEYIGELGEQFKRLNEALGETEADSKDKFNLSSSDGFGKVTTYRKDTITYFFTLSADDARIYVRNTVKAKVDDIIALNESFEGTSDYSDLTEEEQAAIQTLKSRAVTECIESSDIEFFKKQGGYVKDLISWIGALKKNLKTFYEEDKAEEFLIDFRNGVIADVCGEEEETVAAAYKKASAVYEALKNIDGEKAPYKGLKENLENLEKKVFTAEEAEEIKAFCVKWAEKTAASDASTANANYGVLKKGIEALNTIADNFKKMSDGNALTEGEEGISAQAEDSETESGSAESGSTDKDEKALLAEYRLEVVKALYASESGDDIEKIKKGVVDKAATFANLNETLEKQKGYEFSEAEKTAIYEARYLALSKFFNYSSTNDDTEGNNLRIRIDNILKVYDEYKKQTPESFSEEEKIELKNYREKDIVSLCTDTDSATSAALYIAKAKGVSAVMAAYDGLQITDDTTNEYVKAYRETDIKAIRSAAVEADVTTATATATARKNAVKNLYDTYNNKYLSSSQYSEEKKAEIEKSYIEGLKKISSAKDSGEVKSAEADTISNMKHLPIYAIILIIVLPSALLIFFAVFFLIFFRCKVVYRLPDKNRTVFAVRHSMPGKRVVLRDIPERKDFDSEKGVFTCEDGVFELEGIYRDRRLQRPAGRRLKMKLKPRNYYLNFVKVTPVTPKSGDKGTGEKAAQKRAK